MRVFIHGSCVSRDLLPLLSPHGFELTFYSPRQSIIPLLGRIGGLEERANSSRLTSRFQRRAVSGTLRSDLLRRLEHHHGETDLVLWDITDERLGVYESEGRYMTRSLEVISSGLDATLASTARHIPFGSDEHFELWSAALDVWKRKLQRLQLSDRLVLLAPHWASHLDDGSLAPSSFGTHAEEHTRLAERYYATARAMLPEMHLVGHDAQTRGARHHQWGPAPFHYDDVTNAWLARHIQTLVYDKALAFPPPRPIVTQIAPFVVDVTVRRTWARSVALHALKDLEPLVRMQYQDTELFRVNLPEPGIYVFRGFHRTPGQAAAGVSSEPVHIP